MSSFEPVQKISGREDPGVTAVNSSLPVDRRTRRLLWVLAVVLVVGQLAWLNPLP